MIRNIFEARTSQGHIMPVPDDVGNVLSAVQLGWCVDEAQGRNTPDLGQEPVAVDREIAIRPMRSPEDDEFDLSVYASTRLAELGDLGWTPEQINSFVRMQYQAQTRHYRQYFARAAFSIVTADGQAAGRLIVARSDQEILIVDVALLPGYRSAGIGGILVRRLLAEAEEAGLPSRRHVDGLCHPFSSQVLA